MGKSVWPADYMISAVCSQTGVRGALPGGVPWQTVRYTTNNWNSVVEKCGEKVWWNSVVEKCGGKVWWKSVVEKQCGGTVWWKSVKLSKCQNVKMSNCQNVKLSNSRH